MRESYERITTCSGRVILEIGAGNCPYFLVNLFPWKNGFKIRDYGLIRSGDQYIGIDTSDTITERVWKTVSPEEQKRIRSQFKRLRFGSAEASIKKFQTKGLLRGQYEFIEANCLTIPFPDETVDEIVLKNVVGAPECHFVNEDKNSLLGIFLEALRLLKQRGRIVIIEDDTPEAAYEWLVLLDYYKGRRVEVERRRIIERAKKGLPWEFRIDFKKHLMNRAGTPSTIERCFSDDLFREAQLSNAQRFIWGRTF